MTDDLLTSTFHSYAGLPVHDGACLSDGKFSNARTWRYVLDLFIVEVPKNKKCGVNSTVH